MALIPCPECKGQMSDQAVACPHCGAPRAKTPPTVDQQKQRLGGIVFVAIVAAVWFIWPSSDKPGAAPVAADCKSDDLQCLGDKGSIGAGIYCAKEIEKRAQYSVRWIDGTFEMKFSRFRWKDQTAGVITYIGDRAEFQNGYGAYVPVTYECDLAKDGKEVIDVRVSEGRLP